MYSMRCAWACENFARLLVTGAARKASIRFTIHKERMAVLAIVFGATAQRPRESACAKDARENSRTGAASGGQSTGVIMAA